MLLIILCLFLRFVLQVLSEETPAPPQSVHVDKWQLTWAPATEERNVTYTVQYSRFDSGAWTDVPACVRISSASCNVTSTKAQDEQGCIKLRVRTERSGLTSVPAEACSRHGDSCTPGLSVTARPGSFTVHLTRNHSLAQEHADNVKHRVYYGKEGEPLEDYEDGVSSVSIHGLQEGQRYCMKMQYIYYDSPVGLPTCTHCILIPESKTEPKQTEIVVAVVVVLVVVILTPLIAYVLIYHHQRIKDCLRPPYQIPNDFLEPPPVHRCPVIVPCEEHRDEISCLIPV